MSASRFVAICAVLTAATSGAAATAAGHPRAVSATPGALVAVSVEVDGDSAPLYPARDGSGRFYLEAREGRRYAVTLASRSDERLGVVLTVDGLNVISGERDDGRGRMYVLDPRQRTTVRGWRSSLQEVREFTFVDERASYATRSGKANARMGWIEVAVYRERHRHGRWRPWPGGRIEGDDAAAESEAGDAHGGRRESARSDEGRPAGPAAAAAPEAARSYPGTGWGRRTHDPAVLVSFEPESWTAESTILRYEYRSALVALAILPQRHPARDRLSEREHGDSGFARPPLW